MLKLSLFEDTGAIVAAADLSSIPAGAASLAGLHRYCWLRDAFFVVRAQQPV
jgi:GH15 family glucan-1,4-alpha-glucosidase